MAKQTGKLAGRQTEQTNTGRDTHTPVSRETETLADMRRTSQHYRTKPNEGSARTTASATLQARAIDLADVKSGRSG